jgi:hypothetical protein
MKVENRMDIRRYGLDLAERVGAAAAEGFLAVITASGAGIFHASAWQAAGAAGLNAGYAVVKGILAGRVGDRSSAAMLPAAAGGAAGAAVGGAVGTAAGDIVGSVGTAVGDILSGLEGKDKGGPHGPA